MPDCGSFDLEEITEQINEAGYCEDVNYFLTGAFSSSVKIPGLPFNSARSMRYDISNAAMGSVGNKSLTDFSSPVTIAVFSAANLPIPSTVRGSVLDVISSTPVAAI